jgi:hypothetical protein
MHATKDLALVKSPGIRELAARRRAMTVAAVLALALGSGLVGVFTRSHFEAVGRPHTGPFSYIPSE